MKKSSNRWALICSSCMTNTAVSAAAVAPTSTAKVVLADGRLREFPPPVKVSEILRRFQYSPATSSGGKRREKFFVCDADDIGMEAAVPALEAEEELKGGQLYFLLPLSVMGRRLRQNEIGELAVKASSALFKSSAGISSLVFSEVEEKASSGRRRAKEGASRKLGVIHEHVEEEEEEDEN